MISLFFAARGLGLVMHIKDLGTHFARVERHFRVPETFRFENGYAEKYFCKLKVWTVYIFWPLLLMAAFLLPFLNARVTSSLCCNGV